MSVSLVRGQTGRIPSQHGIHDWLAGGNTPTETDDGRLDEYLANLVLDEAPSIGS